MIVLPDLDLSGVRDAYRAKDAARFAEIGARLGLDLILDGFVRYLTRFEESDRTDLVGVVVKQIYQATTHPLGYGFEHVIRSTSRIYTCLAARSEDRVVVGVQRSFRRTPFPNPGWQFDRWFAEPSRNATRVAAWARDPKRASDAIAIALVAPPGPPQAGHDVALLAAVIANPDDDAVRLVYADSLLDRGDVRGELIRLQCELRAGALRDPRRPAIRAREQELLASLGSAMAGDVEWIAERYVIRRGLVDSVTIRASKLARHGKAIVAAHPIRHVRVLVDNAREFAKLGELEVLARIPLIEISGVTNNANKCMAQPEVLIGTRLFATTERLEFLDMKFGTETDRGWQNLIAELHAPRLRALGFDSCGLGPAALDLLAQPTMLPSVRALRIGSPELSRGDQSDRIVALAERPHLRSLELDFLWSLRDPTLARIVADLTERAGELTELAVSRSNAGDATFAAFAELLAVRRLDRLDVGTRDASIAGLAALLCAPSLANLASLVIDRYVMSDQVRDRDALADALLASSGTTRVIWAYADCLGPVLGARVLAHLELVRARDDGSFDLIEFQT